MTERDKESLIRITPGETFAPFSNIDMEELYRNESSINERGFYLEGVGQIRIDVELEFCPDEGTQNVYVAKDENGYRHLVSVPEYLYSTAVVVMFDEDDHRGSKDPLIDCTIDLDGFKMVSHDLEKGKDRIGYAIFTGWESEQNRNNPRDLLLTLEDLPTLKMTFTERERE